MTRPATSLQRQLLAYILLPLGLLLLANAALSLYQARTTAGLIMDEKLLASARVMAQGIHLVDGFTEAQILPSAIEMLATPERDMVFYQLRDGDGVLLAGQADLPGSTGPLGPDQARYDDILFRNQKLRSVEIRQPLVVTAAPRLARIIVGQTLAARDRMARDLWLERLMQQSLLAIVAAALLWLGLRRGLASLNQLRDAMMERKTGALTPLAATNAPVEVQPLVSALNDYISRLNLLMETQRRFIANAAHQLRTPMTLLKTQASFGLRETSSAGKDEALTGVKTSLDHMTRLTNQLLVLARAEPGTNHGARTEVDLVPMARHLLEDFAALALNRNIDLGLELKAEQAIVYGNPTLLRELMSNLVDNALRYTPEAGVVTVGLANTGKDACFSVQDTGPGIPEAERERVFERFYRVSGNSADGSGLGLAIVQEILGTHGGSVTLATPDSGSGLLVTARIPLVA